MTALRRRVWRHADRQRSRRKQQSPDEADEVETPTNRCPAERAQDVAAGCVDPSLKTRPTTLMTARCPPRKRPTRQRSRRKQQSPDEADEVETPTNRCPAERAQDVAAAAMGGQGGAGANGRSRSNPGKRAGPAATAAPVAIRQRWQRRVRRDGPKWRQRRARLGYRGSGGNGRPGRGGCQRPQPV